jgi:hypothetical protein
MPKDYVPRQPKDCGFLNPLQIRKAKRDLAFPEAEDGLGRRQRGSCDCLIHHKRRAFAKQNQTDFRDQFLKTIDREGNP